MHLNIYLPKVTHLSLLKLGKIGLDYFNLQVSSTYLNYCKYIDITFANLDVTFFIVVDNSFIHIFHLIK